MSDFKIDDFEILGTEAFHDFDKRGFDDLSPGGSFGEHNDFFSTREEHCDFRHVGVAYQISGFGSINMKEESFRAHLEIKYVYDRHGALTDSGETKKKHDNFRQIGTVPKQLPSTKSLGSAPST